METAHDARVRLVQAVDGATEPTDRVQSLEQAIDVASRTFIDETSVRSCLISDLDVLEKVTRLSIVLVLDTQVFRVSLKVGLEENFGSQT